MRLFIIITALIFSFLPQMGFTQTDEQPATEAPSEQKIKDFYLSNLKEDGSKDWEVKGTEAVIKDKFVDINNMNAKYYAENNPVYIKSDKAKINKENMNADLKDNVELKIPNKDGTYITITCTGPLEMRYNDGIAIFNENVNADTQDGKLFADKATIYFDAKDNTKMKIVAEGHVKIVKDENVAFADKATYTGNTKKVLLEGSPRLIYFSKKNETFGN
ncbi:MAG: LPS export ABC transporter periplasmic protein LptC [Candidatus Omnitrophota bacterium]|jgi:LPS export ABC transporter protein LptC